GRAWELVATGQFHDDQAGTSTPKAYEYTWNTDVLAMNQFAQVITSATESIAGMMDTSGGGHALVVYNPVRGREDVVEALDTILPPGGGAVRVIGPDGGDVPSQRSGNRILFLAKVPPVSWSVFRVVPEPSRPIASELTATPSSLENARYRIRLDANGDIASIVDKKGERELLAAPIRLAFQTHRPNDWPAWNMDWADQQKPPRGYVTGPAEVRVVESGPVRAAVEVRRKAEGSSFVTTIRLAAGNAGNRIEIDEAIDWRSRAAALKAVVPLAASNPLATYNWQVGTIRRGNNAPKRYEVPTHEWIDLTDASGAHGVTLLTGAKYGSDKPDDHTLRLTLVYTPGIGEGWTYADQATQDWGHHEITWGLASHAGDRRAAATDWQALAMERPLAAFWTAAHPGALGRSVSLLRMDSAHVRVMALKKAEHGDEVILRVVELDGKETPLRVSFAAPLAAAREVDGQELPRGPAKIEEGALVTKLSPFQIRSFAVRLGEPPAKATPPSWQLVLLPYTMRTASA
ncbi:MAG TPA: glycoside hydrolase family 38 C-terminal domain-containing protein, partial [Thermoanaerobaculia bacterium]